MSEQEETQKEDLLLNLFKVLRPAGPVLNSISLEKFLEFQDGLDHYRRRFPGVEIVVKDCIGLQVRKLIDLVDPLILELGGICKVIFLERNSILYSHQT